MSPTVDRLPQDNALTERANALLKGHISEVRDYTTSFHARWAKRGIVGLRDAGFALLPPFIPAERLMFVAAAFHAAMTRLRTRILTLARHDPRRLMREFPYGHRIDEALDLVAGCLSPAFMAHFRPDGFLFEDRYVLSEINYGNGILVSIVYTEMLDDYWAHHPVLRRLDLNHALHHPRPFQRLVHGTSRFCRQVGKPHIALMGHADEIQALHAFPPRVMQQVNLAIAGYAEHGITARLVAPSQVTLDEPGSPRFASDGIPVEVIQFSTVGTSFLDHPEMLCSGGALAGLRGARLSQAWLLKPLAGLLMDKGALPLLTTLGCRQHMPDGFYFDVSPTLRPGETPSGLFLDAQKDWVIKRAFDGKDTHPGIGCDASSWERIVSRAGSGNDYVAQRYVSMPRARIPVFIDGQNLEWIESRVEVSTFLFDGANHGTGIRHAPDAEGLVMTNFPAGYGYTTAYAI